MTVQEETEGKPGKTKQVKKNSTHAREQFTSLISHCHILVKLYKHINAAAAAFDAFTSALHFLHTDRPQQT